MLAQLAFAGLAGDFDGIPVESAAGAFFEIASRIIAGVEIRADDLRVGLHGQLVAVLGKDFSPGVVTSTFGINDEAVEIEDDGANGGGHGLWSVGESSASQVLFADESPALHVHACLHCESHHPRDCVEHWSHGEMLY